MDPIENMEFYISHWFVFVKGFAERITDNGLSVLCSEDTWGLFHISRSHGVGNHDFFVIKFFSANQDYLLPKKSRYDKIQGIKTKRR